MYKEYLIYEKDIKQLQKLVVRYKSYYLKFTTKTISISFYLQHYINNKYTVYTAKLINNTYFCIYYSQ